MVSIACGSTHTVAMTVKGGIMAWGGGTGTTPKPLNVGHKVASVTSSDSATLLLTVSGSLLICQDPSQLPHFQVLVDSRDRRGKEVVAAAVGMDHTVAVTQEGRFLVWTAYPPHTQGTAQQPIEMDVPGGKQHAVFIACGAAHSLAIVAQKRGITSDFVSSANGTNSLANGHASGVHPLGSLSPLPLHLFLISFSVVHSNTNGINGHTYMNGNGSDVDHGDAHEDIFSDATTQQTIARLRSKLASTPIRAGSPLRSPTPPPPTPTNPTPTNPTPPASTQPSLYSRQSLSLLSSRISALSSFNHSKKLEESTLNSSGKRQNLTLPSSLTPFSWKSSVNSRRHSDLDSDDMGLPKHVKQSPMFSNEDTLFGEEADTGSYKGGSGGSKKFRGLHDYMRGIISFSH
jgi:alpha-tubulin suppressor-like RCC1 family protein